MIVMFHPTGQTLFSECDGFNLGEPLQTLVPVKRKYFNVDACIFWMTMITAQQYVCTGQYD